MIIPFQIACRGCGSRDPVDVRLDDSSVRWVCPKCREANDALLDLEFTVGYKLLARSNYEYYTRRDNSMSIILSAMAFECELTWLFDKWMGIKAVIEDTKQPDKETIEEMLRKFGNIRDKIEQVGRFLHPRGLDDFAASSRDLTLAQTGFPSLHLGSLAQDFQETLFWPRNRILHAGYTGYGETDSAKCYSIANFGLMLLRDLDRAKRDDLNRRS